MVRSDLAVPEKASPSAKKIGDSRSNNHMGVDGGTDGNAAEGGEP